VAADDQCEPVVTQEGLRQQQGLHLELASLQ
jgi:hypothetical protein